MYEKVLQLDADNLAANIFLGNYYYLMAEKEKKRLDTDFKKLASPTKMQYAALSGGIIKSFFDRLSEGPEFVEKSYFTISVNRGSKDIG